MGMIRMPISRVCLHTRTPRATARHVNRFHIADSRRADHRWANSSGHLICPRRVRRAPMENEAERLHYYVHLLGFSLCALIALTLTLGADFQILVALGVVCERDVFCVRC